MRELSFLPRQAHNAPALSPEATLTKTDSSPPEARESRAALPFSLEQLHEQYLTDIYRYVSRRLPGREEAEDATAEVFAAAVAVWSRFRGDVSPYLWLLGIARRKVADALRRRRWRELVSIDRWNKRDADANAADGWEALLDRTPSDGQSPEELALRRERYQTLRQLVFALKEEQREALLLHYVDGLSLTEVGIVLGKSPTAVSSLLQRARATVRQRGATYFEEEK